MCIAELNVSTLPCRHRWYHLIRSCSPSTHLGNCPNKLGLEGWEIKCDFCPYCADWAVDDCTYRIVGMPERSASIGRSPSVALSATRRDSRSNSLSRSDSSGSMSMMANVHSEKNRATNARIDAYMMARPDRIQTFERRSNSFGGLSLEEEPASPVLTDRDSGTSGGSDGPKNGMIFGVGKGWKSRTKRISRTFFK